MYKLDISYDSLCVLRQFSETLKKQNMILQETLIDLKKQFYSHSDDYGVLAEPLDEIVCSLSSYLEKSNDSLTYLANHLNIVANMIEDFIASNSSFSNSMSRLQDNNIQKILDEDDDLEIVLLFRKEFEKMDENVNEFIEKYIGSNTLDNLLLEFVTKDKKIDFSVFRKIGSILNMKYYVEKNLKLSDCASFRNALKVDYHRLDGELKNQYLNDDDLNDEFYELSFSHFFSVFIKERLIGEKNFEYFYPNIYVFFEQLINESNAKSIKQKIKRI